MASIAASSSQRGAKTLHDVRRQADASMRAGDWVDALRRYRAVLQGAPLDLDARLRTADALAHLGELELAKDVYRAAAWSYVRGGFPLRAIVAAHALFEIDASAADLLDSITTIFADGSSRIARIGARLSPPVLDEAAAPSTQVLLADPVRDVAHAAWAEARTVADFPELPNKYAPAPIISDVPAEVAAAMVRASRLLRVPTDGVVMEPASKRSSILLVARGHIQLSVESPRGPYAIGPAGEGSFLGHEPFVGGGPVRTRAVAQSDVDALEIPTSALRDASRRSPEAGVALGRILRAELLQSVLRTSPLFRVLPSRQRIDLLRRMQSCRFEAGAYVLRQGKQCMGLYLVLSGEVRIVTSAGEREVHVMTLAAGDLVGLASTAYDAVAGASAIAQAETTMMFLPADAVRRLVAAYPALAAELSVEAMDRADRLRRAAQGNSQPGQQHRW